MFIKECFCIFTFSIIISVVFYQVCLSIEFSKCNKNRFFGFFFFLLFIYLAVPHTVSIFSRFLYRWLESQVGLGLFNHIFVIICAYGARCSGGQPNVCVCVAKCRGRAAADFAGGRDYSEKA